MLTIYNWRARRSGGRITIEGIDEHARPVKLTEIDVIEICPGRGDIVGRRSMMACCVLSSTRLKITVDGAAA